MITVTDAANIVYRHALTLGYETYQKGNIPKGPITTERITVTTKRLTKETFWKKCFVEVNLIAPDIEDEADTIRLNEMEREAQKYFDSLTDEYDGTRYRLSAGESEMFEDGSFHCHYVNIRVLFEILNTK